LNRNLPRTTLWISLINSTAPGNRLPAVGTPSDSRHDSHPDGTCNVTYLYRTSCNIEPRARHGAARFCIHRIFVIIVFRSTQAEAQLPMGSFSMRFSSKVIPRSHNKRSSISIICIRPFKQVFPLVPLLHLRPGKNSKGVIERRVPCRHNNIAPSELVNS